MRITVAQLGARRHYAIPQILHEARMLERFYTDICAGKGWPRLLHIIPTSLRPNGLKRLLGRVPHGIPTEHIVAFNRFGLEYARRRRNAVTRTEATKVHLWAGDEFSKLVLQHGLGEANVLYGFNADYVNLYRGAKNSGLKVVMEQFIAPRSTEQRILEEEFARAPEWERNERDGKVDQVIQREKASWDLADLIICGSEFVRQGVAAEGGPSDKCIVVPYGVELSNFNVRKQAPRHANEPLNVLFVGGIGLRKGVRYLLEAMQQLNGAPLHCRIVGGWSVDPDVLKRHTPPNVELIGHVARSEIASEYARADAFCLPSLCEGSALVVYEALAAGLPIVTTFNTGSIVRDGIEGFVVPVRDSEAIADRLLRLASDPTLWHRMSCAAFERGQEGSIEAYGQRLLTAIRSL